MSSAERGESFSGSALPMLVLIVEFRIRPECAADFERAIVDNARASRETEPGCRQFDVCRDERDPALFMLYELYDDEAAIAAHVASEHFLHMDRLTRDWVVARKVWRCARIAPGISPQSAP
jgi:quinol monooxygenase YgiN